MSAAEAERQQVASNLPAPEAPAPPYETLYERVETITALILDGSLLPEDGLLLALSSSERLVEAEKRRRRMRRSYSDEARARAVALVAGGASCRMAAASVLGSERLYATVWRWAKKKGVL